MNNNNWHIENWHLLGWIETVIKALAIFIGIYVFFLGIKQPEFLNMSSLPTIQLVILIILSAGLLLAIINRYQKKDIISMVFILFNNWGHWGLVYAIFKGVNIKFMYSFVLLMLVGDLVKLVFIKRHNYSEGDIATRYFTILTWIYVVGYLFIIFLGLPTLL
ncbi:MAG: hypothetical protein R6V14_06245 [Halanaerobiales bacterium]